MACFHSVALAGAPVLIMGDSLSAAYGIAIEQSWVTLLSQRLQEQGHAHPVINASISGETTSGGRQRLPALLQKHQPGFVIIELGGNDGLRGQPITHLQTNLQKMITLSQQHGAQVILAGMQIPPNYGRRYTEQFSATFHKLAKRYDAALVPFLLDGVAGEAGMMQRDGIHPTAAAQIHILDNVWPILEPLLEVKTGQ